MQNIKDSIRAYILATYLPGESAGNLRDDTRLISSGILDSLATLGLADFVQRQFDIELSATETLAESFDRIDDIAALVAHKRAA